MSDTINYGALMHQAMRGLIARVLSDVARDGLPGEHHFFITFATGHPGVVLPDWLRERYPDSMTIVMQEWFRDLTVEDDGFSITLNFGNQEVPMTIPFDSILTFVDPSVEFGLRFEASEMDAEDDEESEMIILDDEQDDPDDRPDGDAEVVSLDSFRK